MDTFVIQNLEHPECFWDRELGWIDIEDIIMLGGISTWNDPLPEIDGNWISIENLKKLIGK